MVSPLTIWLKCRVVKNVVILTSDFLRPRYAKWNIYNTPQSCLYNQIILQELMFLMFIWIHMPN